MLPPMSEASTSESTGLARLLPSLPACLVWVLGLPLLGLLATGLGIAASFLTAGGVAPEWRDQVIVRGLLSSLRAAAFASALGALGIPVLVARLSQRRPR